MESEFIEMVMTGRYNNLIKINNDLALSNNYTKILYFIQTNGCNIIYKVDSTIFIEKENLYYNQIIVDNTQKYPQNLIFIKNDLYSNKLILLLNHMKKSGMNIQFKFECELCKKYKEKLFLQNINNFTLKKLYNQMKIEYNTICLCYKYNIYHEIIDIHNEQSEPYVKYIEIIPHYTFLEHHYYISDAINKPIIVCII
jgi:hypothetical protein